MIKIILLLTGGAIGTLARYGLSGLTHRVFEGTFPLGTLMVNLTGSFLIGLITRENVKVVKYRHSNNIYQ